MDFKYSDVESYPDDSIDLCLYNGGIRTDEHYRIANLLRKKSKILISFGACASHGGIPGLANLFERQSMFNRIYLSCESTNNSEQCLPQEKTIVSKEKTIHLTTCLDDLRSLSQVVDVCYVIPGCPPEAENIWAACLAVVNGELPEAGNTTIAAGTKSVCDECPLEKQDRKITQIHRPHEIIPDSQKCLLEQGIICMGPATRSGCKASCLSVCQPCRGCYGPAGKAQDQGAAMIGALSALFESEHVTELKEMVEQIPDPTGTFYRFSLPASMIEQSRAKK